jgi:hypothetical protein
LVLFPSSYLRGVTWIKLEPGVEPPFQSIYHLSPAELNEVKRQLTELLEAGFIQPSKSPFGAPIILSLSQAASYVCAWITGL